MAIHYHAEYNQVMEKVLETRTCKNCGNQFQITDWDRNFYNKINVPFPTHCLFCRSQRRQAQLNQLNLFKRKCDGTHEDIISNYPPDSPYKVYSQKYWATDNFDALKYGRDYDFSKPFFQQYAELRKVVPCASLFTDFMHDENSEYTNSAGKNRNCYMIFDSDENWDCMYSYGMNGSKSSIDCYRVQKLELCYEVVDCRNCYNCYFTYKSENCSDSIFLNNCIGCQHCIYCSNLKNKKHHVFNEPVSKERYEEIKSSLSSHNNLMHKLEKFYKFRLHFPQRYMRGFSNEDVSGDHLVHCKNVHDSFDSMYLWDGKYCNQIFIKGKDFMDCDECGESELVYESTNVAYNCYNMRFCVQCMQQANSHTYCYYCMGGHDLFGCVGIKRNEYCILNKKYSKEEYEELIPKIIEHMGPQYGEFFPIDTSSFPYNLTMAQDRFPLTKEQALQKGYTWRDEDPKEYREQKYEIPDDIKDVPETIKNEILSCMECGRNYKIMPLEFNLYKRLNLPIPRNCFYCRNKARRINRNERKLYDRTCQKCGMEIKTTYSSTQPEIVYCEKCYQDSMK